jgi:hypothetical protein
MDSTWEARARHAIEYVTERIMQYDTKRAYRRALNDRYPFGDRKYWPYKIWLRVLRAEMARFDYLHGDRQLLSAAQHTDGREDTHDDLPLFQGDEC